MSGNLVAFLGFLAMIVLIGLRMPIGMSMLVVGIGATSRCRARSTS